MYFYSTEVTKYNHDKPEQLEWFPELIIIERNDGTVFDFMKKYAEVRYFYPYGGERHFYSEKLEPRRFVIKLDNIQQFLDNNTIDSYVKFHKENPEIWFVFCFYRMSDYGPQLVQLMRDNDMKFFYADYVRTWDTLNGFVNEGVTDVYIVEELGFSGPLT